MKEDTPETFSITSIEFIFRRPWIFISSIIIIMSLVHAKVSLDPLEYESQAVLSFETREEESPANRNAERKLLSIKKNLVSKALLGDNIRAIMKEVWPYLNERENPVEYNKTLEGLRDPKKGIEIGDDKKIPANLLELSYRNADPEISYKVLQAIINGIKRENKRGIEEKIEAKLDFLRDQRKFYKDKLNDMNKQIADIKNELVERFPELTDREKDLIAGIGVKGKSAIVGQGSLETYVMYDEMLTKLNIELLEAQKKKENLEKHIEEGTLVPRPKTTRTAKKTEKDIFVEKYEKAIADKELQVAELLARGYTRDHPEAKKIQTEINRLKIMTGERVSTLREEGLGLDDEAAQAAAIEKNLAEMEEIDFEIEAMESKINLIKEYRKQSQEQLKPRVGSGIDVYEKVEKLKELQKESEINEGYYLDIRKQLEEAELKARLEKEEAGFKIDVIEEPSVPLNPISYQKVKLLMLGFIISLMVGSGLAYFVDSLDNSVRSAKELRELINLPVLASIDRLNTTQEIMAKRVQRNTVIVCLFIFVIVSKILVKLFVTIF